MGQTTFDDDDLFGEAAEEVREDVEAALDDARAALPAPDDVWDADADNVLGVLNGLRSAMDPGAAEEHVRDAKKWYTMGERADAFDDGDDIADEIAAVEDVVGEMAAAREGVSDLAGTVPELRSALEDARDAADAEPDAEAEADADDGEETAADGGEPQDEEAQATLDDAED
jgi:hypothetical protein